MKITIRLCLSAAMLGLPGLPMAQTPTQQIEPIFVPDTPITAVTIFGSLPKRPGTAVRRLDRNSAGSCAFSFTSYQDQIIDDYLDHFEGRGRSTDNTNMGADAPPGLGDRTEGFLDSSPYGSAAGGERLVTPAEDSTQTSAGCSQADRNFAAGRNYIARKDKTLDLAFAAYDAGDFPKALEAFKTSYSAIGYDEAALMLGNMYFYGQGAPRDTRQAITWYDKLADSRLNPSQYSPFDPKDPERASLRVQAQLRLARIYMAGYDVPKDPVKARQWYKAAAELNFVPARYVLARFYQSGYGSSKDIQEAVKLYTNAAEYAYVPAQLSLANLYYYGDEVKQDLPRAFAWYQQAAKQKKPQALYALALMFDQGQGVAADPAKALAFYKEAAVAGHPDAQNSLATYFYTGQIVSKNLQIARNLFQSAAMQSQPDAMVNLAAMLLKGEGAAADKPRNSDEDTVKAYVWLKLVAKLGRAPAASAAEKLETRLSDAQKAQAKRILTP
ncbi:SEL1-like repeat protein [Undibacterium sp. CY18W]|uniref:SEL1-like repeat protein n=1 Tax=Undibacterium hunanense TaxID=2762292 RepID=A0ABR6ZM69_9BURK|nr:SEL1-like repeat protein [Undibacterium hunanense]MBC3916977.1 SEL1-like repeat protein [Undibacterium hunanense]